MASSSANSCNISVRRDLQTKEIPFAVFPSNNRLSQQEIAPTETRMKPNQKSKYSRLIKLGTSNRELNMEWYSIRGSYIKS